MTSAQLQPAWVDQPALSPARARRPPGFKTHASLDREDARDLCVGVLGGAPIGLRSLLVEVGTDDATLILAAGDQPVVIWQLSALARELTDRAPQGRESLRAHVRQALDGARVMPLRGLVSRIVVTSSGAPATREVIVEELLDRVGGAPARS